jgi:transcription-repair coupling factor (superfamily II helicase)
VIGKTEVAMRAIYRAVLANKQVALLAPTRILALQHCRVLSERMPDVSVRLLRGGGSSDKSGLKGDIKSGACQVVVGTHALLQPTGSRF